MRQTLITLACSLALLNAASAQSPEGAGAAAHQMVRAAGMPLRDGTLAPGTLTVRLVRGSFDGDLMGHTVEAEIAGQRTLREETGEQGRAQFAHLPIGATVRASAVVGGERMQSDVIVMPAESGVRVLLVTGMGGPIAVEPLAPAPIAPVESEIVAVEAQPSQRSGIFIDSATLARAAVISLTVFAFAGVGLQQWRRRRGPRGV